MLPCTCTKWKADRSWERRHSWSRFCTGPKGWGAGKIERRMYENGYRLRWRTYAPDGRIASETDEQLPTLAAATERGNEIVQEILRQAGCAGSLGGIRRKRSCGCGR
jgi:hypothetical protein